MIRRYNIKAGIIFSIIISLLSSFPKFVRFDFTLLNSFFYSFIYLFFNFFGCWLIHNYFLLKKFRPSFWNNVTVKAIISTLVSLLFIVTISYKFKLGYLYPVSQTEEMSMAQVLSIRLFRGAIISVFTFFVVYYFRMMITLQRSKLENEYLKQENLKAQLASLKEQISPHFLFNSLNTLSTLSHENTVKEYILKMSEVYRYVLHYQQQNEVFVKDELSFIQSYIYILETRFEEGLKINTRIRQENLRRKVLPFSLQLLVENAVKHNTISYQKPLVIDIYDSDRGIVVENVFRPKNSTEKHSGTGLSNLSQRYQLATRKEITIAADQNTFKVEIPFL